MKKKILVIPMMAFAFVFGASMVQAATPAVGQGLYEGVSTAVPRLEQSEPIAASDKYFSTYIQRDRSSELPSMLSGTVAAAATRCPAFVKWEDWGGARWHAYVDFRPSDLCDGRHVKRAYVRLIRECGPYYEHRTNLYIYS